MAFLNYWMIFLHKVLYIINYFMFIAYTNVYLTATKMEKQPTHQESLEIITEMIQNAKSNLAKGGSFYFLLWGALVALANFIIYYLINFTNVSNWYYVWLITIPAIPITIIHGKRAAARAKVKGPFDHIYGQVWIGVFVAMIISLIFMAEINYAINPIMLIYSGIGTYISGMLCRYRPLVVGGVILWGCAIIAFLTPMAQQFLVAGVGIIAGYVIPGLMLRKEER